MSPRPGPRRTAVTIRLKTEALAYVDALAATEQLSRSEMIRRLLREGVAYRQRRGQVAGLAVAARAAADWETAWDRVTKTVDGSADKMAKLGGAPRAEQAIRELRDAAAGLTHRAPTPRS